MSRLTKRAKVRIACLLALCLLAVPAVRIGWKCYEWMVWTSIISSVEREIDSLKPRRPATITQEHWDEATGMARTALWNLWPWDVDNREELAIFAAGFKNKVAAGDDLAALRWLWDELERRNPSGPNYAAQYKPVRAMNPGPITDANLGQLWGLNGSYFLDLSGTEVSDAGLGNLLEAKNLSQLDLSNVRITDVGLAQLAQLPDLRYLELKGCQITGIGLSELSRLRDLNLAGTTILDDGLPFIGQMADLEKLDLSGTRITDTGLEALRNLSALTELNLSGTLVTGAGFRSLQDLDKLETLYLNDTQISEAGLTIISTLAQLDTLRLEKTKVDDAALHHLSRLQNLRFLSLEGTQVTGNGMHHLIGSLKLRYLLLPEGMSRREELNRLHQAIPECWIYLGGQPWSAQPLRDPRGEGGERMNPPIGLPPNHGH